ncbi:DNA-cytosine methyltransferase [Halothece sp. PCC 7418]|uniref:DNA cytosine methyltransferase n=1 Tax=Halothece sp. (strain PCC 7418) TaxID=65093 RepID=UPI0002A0875F|nr:DNA cytosine methyltransferase [Halothece sp. PCC 7418]AFZ45767.1 DNA-cytosine methyltransferase [Halothece sp. PCC 7418]
MTTFTFVDLFAGIGGIRIAFENIGGKCVFSSEWDRYAQKSYQAYFLETPHGDITQIDAEKIPDHDILTAGFPCQTFSILGDRKGFTDTRGTLFFDIERILKVKRPKAFLLENVKNLVSHDQGRTFSVIKTSLESLGYTVYSKVLNALDFGLPQKRERIIIIGFLGNYSFRFPEVQKERANLKDFLEDDKEVDPKHYASEKVVKSVWSRLKSEPFFPSVWHENKSGNISVLPYSCALRAGASYNYLLVNGVRRLTSRENLRLQGFPDNYPIVVPHSQIRKQGGNSVPIPMIQAVAKELILGLNLETPSHEGYRVKIEESGQLAFL